MAVVVTLPHKVQPSRYALHLIRLWMRRNAWWAFGLPVVVSLMLAMFIDTKFVFLAVVIVCLVLPHIFVSVYWRHLLSDDTCRWLPSHVVTFDNRGLTVDYVDDETDEDGSDNRKPRRTSFAVSTIAGCRLTDTELVVNTSHDDPYKIVIIPLSAIEHNADMVEACRILMANTSNPS